MGIDVLRIDSNAQGQGFCAKWLKGVGETGTLFLVGAELRPLFDVNNMVFALGGIT